MTAFWRTWLTVWCAGVALFGVILAGGAFEATSGPVRLLYAILSGGMAITYDAPIRFSIALMGAITLGWSVTFYAAIQSAIELGERGKPIWTLITASVLGWFVIDSALSVATGFALNVIPNTALVVGYLIPVLASGVLNGPATAPRAT